MRRYSARLAGSFTLGSCLLMSVGPAAAHGHQTANHNLHGGHQTQFNSLNPFLPEPPGNLHTPRVSSGVIGRDFDLDLSSSVKNIMLGSKTLQGLDGVTIDVGGNKLTFHAGDAVTAAQFVAIEQVASNTAQTITIDSKGSAAGGSFSLNQSAGAAHVGNLIVPQGVAAVDNFASHHALGFSGDLINNGSIYGFSTNNKVRNGLISADDITNNGLITTDLNGSFLAPLAGTQKHVDLTLAANHDLTNNGTISSSGSLTLATAYGAVKNAPSAVISAAKDVNIFSGSGDVLSQGTVSAGGDINIAATNASTNLNILGGNYYSNNLNVNGGDGSIFMNVGDITGKLSTSGEEAHVYSDSATLVLGQNCLKGDPTFVSGGDILINGAVIANSDIVILANGNITASGDAFISTANATGTTAVPTHDITLVAGAQITTSGVTTSTIPNGNGPLTLGQTATVDFSVTGTGGFINLSGSTHKGAVIDASSNLAAVGFQQANGGNVTLSASSATTQGSIILPTGGINASSIYGSGGNVSIIGSGVSNNKKLPDIKVGNINATCDPVLGSGVQGNVEILSAQPFSLGVITYDSAGKNTTANNIQGGTLTSGKIQLAGTINGGFIDIVSDPNGTGAITQLGTGRVIGSILDLIGGTGGVGGGSKPVPILTQVLRLSVSANANVAVNNLGSVILLNSKAGDKGIFSLTTTPDSVGNGQITINANQSITAFSGQLDTINLTSSERGAQGGIQVANNNTKLAATNINLKDGANGLGIGDIGSSIAKTIIASCANLSINTGGNVFAKALGSVTLLDSSAGSGTAFILGTTPVANNGSITLGGDIHAASGKIASISLDSSESGGGTGGILPGGILIATAVAFSDSNGGGFIGNGTGNLGTAASPLTVQSTTLSGLTNGNSVNLSNSITTGMFLAQSATNKSAGSSIKVTSASAINVVGALTTGSDITLVAGGKGKSSTGISIENILTASNVGSTCTLTTSGDIGSTPGSKVSAETLTLNSANGRAGSLNQPLTTGCINLFSNVGGFTNIFNANGGFAMTVQSCTAHDSFNLLCGDPITVVPAILAAKSVKIVTATTSGLTLQGSIGSTKTTESVELLAETGAITAAPGVVISGGSVTLGSQGGNIGSNVAPLTVQATYLSANSRPGTGAVFVDVLGAKKGATTLLDSGSAGDFNLNSTGSLNLSNLTTVNGSINVTCSGTLLSVLPNSLIQVGDKTTPATGASTILLQNTQVGAKTGGILIGADSQINTFVTAPAISGGPGTISILTGAPGVPTNTSLPTNVKIKAQSGGGTTFFGTNSITALAPDNFVTNATAFIIFDTGGRPASAITLGGGVTMISDPLITGDGPHEVSISDIPLPTTPLVPVAVHVPSNHFSGQTQIHTFDYSIPTTTMVANTVPLTDLNLGSFSNLSVAVATTEQAISAAPVAAEPIWISETEIEGGEIPAFLLNEPSFHLESGESSAVAFSSTGPSYKTLKRGSILVSPTVETVIETSHGKIKIAPGAMALIMALSNGFSVYDLDDLKRGSIEVTSAGKTITLCPGQHITIAPNTVRSFDEINPAQLIGYRNIAAHNIAHGMTAFTAEFSIPHAINAVKPLKKLLESNHPSAKKSAAHLLKTTAVLMQLRGNDYHQIFRPQRTAWAK